MVFNMADVRDMVMTNTNKLASLVDESRIRLEVPQELKPTFCLLSRFGARLRARHGKGPKWYVKYGDFDASLYSVIKLPVDSQWTRVSPDTMPGKWEGSSGFAGG